MKFIIFYTCLLFANISFAQGVLPEERDVKERFNFPNFYWLNDETFIENRLNMINSCERNRYYCCEECGDPATPIGISIYVKDLLEDYGVKGIKTLWWMQRYGKNPTNEYKRIYDNARMRYHHFIADLHITKRRYTQYPGRPRYGYGDGESQNKCSIYEIQKISLKIDGLDFAGETSKYIRECDEW